MKYAANSKEIELLKEAVKESVKETVGEIFRGLGQEVPAVTPFPLRTARQVAALFGVSVHTVKSWVRQGELHPRYQVLSGRTYRLIFTTPDLLDFFDRNFPSEADLGHPCDPRSRKGALIEKMLRMNRLYARRRQPKESHERAE